MAGNYEMALRFAGAKVIAYEEFGSYQGDWFAKVEYKNQIAWVWGRYGSCSGCDAFEADLGYGNEHEHADGKYISTYNFEKDQLDDCVECQSLKAKIVKFGLPYLDDLLTFEDIFVKASEDIEWDMEAKEMIDWLNKNK